MKVYELMAALSGIESGKDITIDICMTTEELKAGVKIDDYCYQKRLNVSEVNTEDGIIYTSF